VESFKSVRALRPLKVLVDIIIKNKNNSFNLKVINETMLFASVFVSTWHFTLL
jgi:hypothetical protein